MAWPGMNHNWVVVDLRLTDATVRLEVEASHEDGRFRFRNLGGAKRHPDEWTAVFLGLHVWGVMELHVWGVLSEQGSQLVPPTFRLV